MPEWLIAVLLGATGGPGVFSLVMQVLDKRNARQDAADERAAGEPMRDWELKAAVMATAEELHDNVRAELAHAMAELQRERAAFQSERAAMLQERAAWAEERRALIAELNSERTQRRSLEVEVDHLKERVGVLEARLRELGHDPDTIG